MYNGGLFRALVAFPFTKGLNPLPSAASVSDVEIHDARRPAARWPCKCQLRLPIGRMLAVSSWKLTWAIPPSPPLPSMCDLMEATKQELRCGKGRTKVVVRWPFQSQLLRPVKRLRQTQEKATVHLGLYFNSTCVHQLFVKGDTSTWCKDALRCIILLLPCRISCPAHWVCTATFLYQCHSFFFFLFFKILITWSHVLSFCETPCHGCAAMWQFFPCETVSVNVSVRVWCD